MPHGFVMFEQGPSLEDLFALTEQDDVRAVVRGFGGVSLVFLHTEQVELTAGAADRIRGTMTTAATTGLVVPIPPLPVAVGMEPEACSLFVLLELARGRQHAYAKYLQGVGSGPEGVKHAVGLVLGCPRVHAVLEVVGEDWLNVLERLDLLTAHDDVTGVQTIPVAAEHIRGAGSDLAWGP